MSWPALMARIRITTKRTRKIKNRILDICAAPRAMPVQELAMAAKQEPAGF
jgi:hypothetical protein